MDQALELVGRFSRKQVRAGRVLWEAHGEVGEQVEGLVVTDTSSRIV